MRREAKAWAVNIENIKTAWLTKIEMETPIDQGVPYPKGGKVTVSWDEPEKDAPIIIKTSEDFVRRLYEENVALKAENFLLSHPK